MSILLVEASTARTDEKEVPSLLRSSRHAWKRFSPKDRSVDLASTVLADEPAANDIDKLYTQNKRCISASGDKYRVFLDSNIVYHFSRIPLTSLPREEESVRTVVLPRESTLGASTRPIVQVDLQASVIDDLAEQVHQIFRSGEFESFDFGRESNFSRQIVDFVKEQGKKAVSALDDFFAESRWNPELVAESLLWLGDMDDPATHEARRELLLGALTNKSIVIRADAITAVEFLADPRTISAMQEALGRESVPELKNDLEQAIRFLETRRHGLASARF